MKKKMTTIISTISIILFIVFLSLAFSIKDAEKGILFDESMMEWVHKNINSNMTIVMKGITFLGSTYFFMIVGVLLLFYFIKTKHYEGIFPLLFSTIGSFSLNAILKHIFTRTRPIEYFLIHQGGYSFPSGHAMVSMSFYTTMTYFVVKNKKYKNKNYLFWILNFLIVGLIGFSRIYLGVHWPTDVLAGYMMGFLVYLFTIFLSGYKKKEGF